MRRAGKVLAESSPPHHPLTGRALRRTERAVLGLHRTVGNQALLHLMGVCATGPTRVDGPVYSQIASKIGGGMRLRHDVRHVLEEGLAADLSKVQVHVDYEADHLARV